MAAKTEPEHGARRLAPTAGARARPKAPPSDVDTIVVVDVDGVLNVGAAEVDEGRMPILLTDTNLAIARQMWSKRTCHPECTTVEKLVAMGESSRPGEGGESLGDLVAKAPSRISEVLTGRLAEILEVGGPRAIAVLSSTWQQPRHKARLQHLEQALGKALGRAFQFDAYTGAEKEEVAEERVKAIAQYVARVTRPGGAAAAAARAGQLRVLVLEDFFITPLTGQWSAGGRPMDSEAAVEEYLRQHVPPTSSAAVKLVHTYAEWTSDGGLLLQCGVGLSVEHVRRSKEFLARATLTKADEAAAGTPEGVDWQEVTRVAADSPPKGQDKLGEVVARAAEKGNIAGGTLNGFVRSCVFRDHDGKSIALVSAS